MNKFIYTNESCGKKYLKINLFGIKLSFNMSLKKRTNKIYLKTLKGELKRIRKVKGLKIDFQSSGSTVIIHEPMLKFGKCKISLGENCLFEIGAETKKEMAKVSKVNFRMADNSKILLGDNLFFGSGEVTLMKNSSLTVGDDCMFSYDVLIRIGDGHPIINTQTGERIPSYGNVVIGDRVWLGARTAILKNAQLANDTIVGACSVVTKKFEATNTAIAGNPAKIIKENIAWSKKS